MLVKQDPISPWFKAVESMGEYVGIRFGQINEDAHAVDWLDLPHTEYDGIGGFAKILRDRGAGIECLPRIPHPVSESWWPFVKAIPAMLSPRKRLSIVTGSAAKNKEHGNMPPQAIAWHVFSDEETSSIRKAGRIFQISINSLLLRHLDRSIRLSLEDPSALVTWMVPVNLRGKITQEVDTSNHSSYVAVDLSASETPLDVHKQIYRRLKGGEHWANWKAYTLGKYLPPGIKERMIKNDRAAARWNIGSFSNLGIWDKHKEISSKDCQGPWIFAPPVIDGIRIGAGCITYQNRLGIMIQAHPALTTDASITEAWMKEWVSQIQIDMTTPRSNHYFA